MKVLSILGLLVLVSLTVAGVAVALPDIVRYLRIRQM